jgi:hypothetical protein
LRVRAGLADRTAELCSTSTAHPPDTVVINYDLNKVIGNNETGFHGTNDLPYRVAGWEFILAGGGRAANDTTTFDYSFAAGSEDGTFVYPGGELHFVRMNLRTLSAPPPHLEATSRHAFG